MKNDRLFVKHAGENGKEYEGFVHNVDRDEVRPWSTHMKQCIFQSEVRQVWSLVAQKRKLHVIVYYVR
jgi:hypothetical protein